MSFASDYNTLRKKRLYQAEKEIDEKDIVNNTPKSSKTTSNHFSEEYNSLRLQREPSNDDIAPTRVSYTSDESKKEKSKGWFDAGAFSDGYQFGDVVKTILGTASDVVENINTAVVDATENLIDTGAYVVGLFGDDEFKKDVKGFIGKDLLHKDEVGKWVSDYLSPIGNANLILNGGDTEEASVLDEKSDGIVQSGAHVVGSIALNAVAPGVGTLAQGVNAFGSEIENAAQYEDATYGEMGVSGAVSAAAEIIFEKISSGIKVGGKAWDEAAQTAISRGIADKAARYVVKNAGDMTMEGLEEVATEYASALGRKFTYMDDKEFEEIVSSEDMLDAFIGGAIMSGAGSAVKTGNAAVKGVDSTTGLSANEEKVVRQIYDDAVAEAEAKGEKVNKNKLWTDTVERLNRGEIDLDTIEKTLGGDDYTAYNDILQSEDAIRKEFEELGKKETPTLADQTRYAELDAQIKGFAENSDREALRKKLSDNVLGQLTSDRKGSGSALLESYNQRAQRGVAFTADLDKYDAKQKEIVQKVIDAGFLNNTRKTHEFVDFVAKVSADKGKTFDFTTNEKLKESGFAIDGKTVNGYVTKDGVTINMNAAKALNSVVGHEITHVLEGTELYTELQKSIIQYAKDKGDYQGRYDTLTELYKGVKADIDAELTADLVGDYLFTDNDFIANLSTKNRNVFQKLFDEVKYLYKVATAGSAEKRELEKVKKLFEDAYRADGKAQGDTKYSLYMSEKDIPEYLKAGSRRNKNRQARYENGQQMIISTDEEFNSFVKKSIDGESDNMVAYGKVDEELATQVSEKSDDKIDVADAYLELLSDDVRHAYREHSKAKENGDMDMSVDDLIYALKNVNQSEVVSARIYSDGAQRVTLAVPTDDGTMMLVELASKSAGTLRLKTGWKVTEGKFAQKYRSGTPSAEGVSPTNTARDATASDDIVPQSEQDVNTQFSISSENGEIKDVSTGYSDGESYYTMSFEQDGKTVGTLEYGEYDGKPNVKMVEVEPEYRRKGIATKLLQELQNKYPDAEIDFGMTTPDGTKLLDSITYDVTDESVVADRQRLKDLQTELNDLQGKLDGLYELIDNGENLTEAQETALHDLGDRWNEAYDSIRELEKSLQGKRATKTFVKTDAKFSISDSDGKTLTNEQSEYFKDSKMRDDDGNLMVMYHGSQDAGFHVFDPSMSDDGTSFFFVDRNDVAASYSGTTETYEAQTIHTAEDMNNFIESIGAEGYEVVEKDGKFTLLYEGERVADSNTAKGIYDEFCWYEGVGEGDANYKVYLNLKNPLEIDAKGRPWNKIDAEFSQEVYDKYQSLTAEEKAALTDLAEWEDFRVFNSEIQEATEGELASAYAKMGEDCNIYDLFSVAADNFSEESMRENARGYLKTRDYAQRAKEQGYDGVIFKNIHDNGGYSNGSEGASTVAIAFDSNQIKSVANEKPTGDDDIRYSLSRNSELMQNAEDFNSNNLVIDLDTARQQRQEIYDYMTRNADRLKLPEDIEGNTAIKNSSYDITEENTTVCIRSMAADALCDAVAEELGRPLTVEDTLRISQDLMNYTDEPECVYCYVATDRKAYREFLGSYHNQMQSAIEEIRSGKNPDEVYREFLDGRKDTKNMQNRFAMWKQIANGGKMISAKDLASEKMMQNAMRDPELAAQVKDARAYAQSASWAKKRQGYQAYDGHILDWSQKRINDLNKHYGLRFYSFSDFSPAFVLENMQQITDASVRGLKGLAYTKVLDFAEIFAPTGININISVFGYDNNGVVAQDGMMGADWKGAQDLRSRYENVGVTFVATNDAQIEWALNQDWIDVVIPYHLVRTGRAVAEHFGYTNYTSESGDTKGANWKKGDKKTIYPSEHNNDKQTYLAALAEANLEPRFARWVDHPNYMKLVNETRRSANDTPPMQAVFNVDAAKASLDGMMKRGGYFVPIGGDYENMQDIARGIADDIRGEKSLSLSAEDAPVKRDSRLTYGEDVLLEQDVAPVQDGVQDGVQDSVQDVAPVADEAEMMPDSVPTTEEEANAMQTENIETLADDIAPVGEKAYEAIRPKPIKEPRLKRVKDANDLAPTPDVEERSWYETSTGSDAVDNLVTPDDIPDDVRYYQVKSNKKTLETANARLARDGFAKSREYFEGRMADRKLTTEDIALGERLIQEAAKAGDKQAVRDLIIDVSIIGTELGQRVQALSLIRRLTPEGQLKALVRTVDRGKAKGDKAFDGVEVTDDMAGRITDVYNEDGTFDQAELDSAVEDVKQQIANQMSVSTWDKVNAWRYLSMLGNPKTHIRNIVSNFAMLGTRKVKNTIARTIEGIAPIKSRTKTWARASDAVKAFAKQTTKEMDAAIKEDTKYSEVGSIKAKRKMFNSKVLNAANDLNSGALELEDAIFSKNAFRETLQEYLTANGIKTDADIKNNPELVEKAKEYALEESRKATFRQDSYFANKISEIEQKNPFYGLAVGSIMPFKKTPINIAKTGLAYSPLGFARNIYDAVQVKKGNMDASEAIDHLAQSLTGTSLTLIGFALASAGVLNGAGEDDKEGKYDYQLGEQSYSFNFGGDSYSLSWLSPVAMPLFVGANAYETLVEKKEWDANVVVDTLAQTLDPLSEMSFLSSLDDVLSSYDSGIEKFMGAGEAMVQNYATQFIPTLSSQIATTFDDTKRSTKASGTSGFEFGEETWNKIKYKIPGLRNTLEPTTDIWGNEVKQDENVFVRAFESFISPANKREGISTEIDEELKSLYGETGDASLIPSIPSDYLNYDGEKYDMSAKEYTTYKKTYGQTALDLMEQLFDTNTYKSATSEERADMVSRVYDYARDKAKYEYFSAHGVQYTNAQEDNVDVFKENAIKGAIEADLPVAEYTFSQEYPKKYEFFKSVGIAYRAYKEADEDGKRAYTWAYENPGKYEVSKAISDDFMEYYGYKSVMNDFNAKDENGETVSGLKKERVIEYINGLDLDYGQKIILLKSQYKTDDDYNYDIIDYLNSRNDISYDEMVTILKELGFTVDSDGNIYWD